MKSCEDISSFVTEEKEVEDENKHKIEYIHEKSSYNEKSALKSNWKISYGSLENEDIPKVKEEKCQTGSIKRAVYSAYLKAGLSPLTGLTLVVFLSTLLGSLLYSDIWLSKWTNSNDGNLIHCELAEASISSPSNFKANSTHLAEACSNISESNNSYFKVYGFLVIGLGMCLYKCVH